MVTIPFDRASTLSDIAPRLSSVRFERALIISQFVFNDALSSFTEALSEVSSLISKALYEALSSFAEASSSLIEAVREE